MNKTKIRSKDSRIFKFTKEDFSKKNFIEGGIIRPSILLSAFLLFVIAVFLLLLQNYKWGGSFIIFSFFLNLSAIYISLTDEDSIFRTMNLLFKIVLFISEIVIFNWLITKILY